jgi:hypothetical protein
MRFAVPGVESVAKVCRFGGGEIEPEDVSVFAIRIDPHDSELYGSSRVCPHRSNFRLRLRDADLARRKARKRTDDPATAEAEPHRARQTQERRRLSVEAETGGAGMTSDASERRFERLAEDFLGRPGVSRGTGFGSNPGLRVRGKIFAMMRDGDLVVKLPAAEVDELVASGVGVRFDAGKGRPMKEWVVVSARASRRWPALAQRAFDHVRPAVKGRR